MVKIEDGSLVSATELIDGGGRDPEDKPLKFEQVKESNVPTYKAEAPIDDGTGRVRVYSFSLADTNVVVHMGIRDDAEAERKAKEASLRTEKVTKEVSPSTASTTEAKKNSSPTKF